MASRLRTVAGAAGVAVILGGCAAPLTERLRPGLDGAKHLVDLGICHTADAVRFTAAGIGNVVDQSTKGIVHLVVHAGDAARDGDGAVILAITGGVLGTGAGIAKTLDDWRPGVEACLRDRAGPSPDEPGASVSS